MELDRESIRALSVIIGKVTEVLKKIIMMLYQKIKEKIAEDSKKLAKANEEIKKITEEKLAANKNNKSLNNYKSLTKDEAISSSKNMKSLNESNLSPDLKTLKAKFDEFKNLAKNVGLELSDLKINESTKQFVVDFKVTPKFKEACQNKSKIQAKMQNLYKKIDELDAVAKKIQPQMDFKSSMVSKLNKYRKLAAERQTKRKQNIVYTPSRKSSSHEASL